MLWVFLAACFPGRIGTLTTGPLPRPGFSTDEKHGTDIQPRNLMDLLRIGRGGARSVLATAMELFGLRTFHILDLSN